MKQVCCLIFALAIAILSGCAINDQVVKNINSVDSSKDMNLLLEPVDTTGILETSFLKAGKTTFFEGTFPELLFLGEIHPGRIKWFGWFVGCDKKESLAQLLWTYRVRLNGKLNGTIAIESDPIAARCGKVIGLSTRFDYAYSLDDGEKEIPIVRARFDSEPNYRAEIAEQVGTDITALKKVDYMYPLISNWSRVEGPRGVMLTPLDQKTFEYVAAINPAYSHSQKFVEKFSATLMLDPIATGATWFFEFATASSVPPQGWDYGSKEDKRTSAIKAKHLVDVKFGAMQKMIETLSRTQKEVKK